MTISFSLNWTLQNIINLFLVNWYKMKNLGSGGQFIRTKLNQNVDEKIIFLFQEVYVKKDLKHANMLDYKPI